jgi:protein involved in polysaccharide export with SLBB domain
MTLDSHAQTLYAALSHSRADEYTLQFQDQLEDQPWQQQDFSSFTPIQTAILYAAPSHSLWSFKG